MSTHDLKPHLLKPGSHVKVLVIQHTEGIIEVKLLHEAREYFGVLLEKPSRRLSSENRRRLSHEMDVGEVTVEEDELPYVAERFSCRTFLVRDVATAVVLPKGCIKREKRPAATNEISLRPRQFVCQKCQSQTSQEDTPPPPPGADAGTSMVLKESRSESTATTTETVATQTAATNQRRRPLRSQSFSECKQSSHKAIALRAVRPRRRVGRSQSPCAVAATYAVGKRGVRPTHTVSRGTAVTVSRSHSSTHPPPVEVTLDDQAAIASGVDTDNFQPTPVLPSDAAVFEPEPSQTKSTSCASSRSGVPPQQCGEPVDVMNCPAPSNSTLAQPVNRPKRFCRDKSSLRPMKSPLALRTRQHRNTSSAVRSASVTKAKSTLNNCLPKARPDLLVHPTCSRPDSHKRKRRPQVFGKLRSRRRCNARPADALQTETSLEVRDPNIISTINSLSDPPPVISNHHLSSTDVESRSNESDIEPCTLASVPDTELVITGEGNPQSSLDLALGKHCDPTILESQPHTDGLVDNHKLNGDTPVVTCSNLRVTRKSNRCSTIYMSEVTQNQTVSLKSMADISGMLVSQKRRRTSSSAEIPGLGENSHRIPVTRCEAIRQMSTTVTPVEVQSKNVDAIAPNVVGKRVTRRTLEPRKRERASPTKTESESVECYSEISAPCDYEVFDSPVSSVCVSKKSKQTPSISCSGGSAAYLQRSQSLTNPSADEDRTYGLRVPSMEQTDYAGSSHSSLTLDNDPQIDDKLVVYDFADEPEKEGLLSDPLSIKLKVKTATSKANIKRWLSYNEFSKTKFGKRRRPLFNVSKRKINKNINGSLHPNSNTHNVEDSASCDSDKPLKLKFNRVSDPSGSVQYRVAGKQSPIRASNLRPGASPSIIATENNCAVDGHSDLSPIPCQAGITRSAATIASHYTSADGHILSPDHDVWGKVKGYPWWPAKVVHIKPDPDTGKYLACVSWYSTTADQVSYLPCCTLYDFKASFSSKNSRRREKDRRYRKAIEEAKKHANFVENVAALPSAQHAIDADLNVDMPSIGAGDNIDVDIAFQNALQFVTENATLAPQTMLSTHDALPDLGTSCLLDTVPQNVPEFSDNEDVEMDYRCALGDSFGASIQQDS